MAISESSSEDGLMLRPQSAKIRRAVGAELRGVGAHHKEGRDQLGARGGLEDLQRGAQGVGGGVAGAGDQAVGIAHLDHHGAKVGGVHHLGASLLDGDALLGAELGKLLRVLLVLLGVARVDDGGAGNVDVIGVAQDDDVGRPSSMILFAATMVRGSSPSGRTMVLRSALAADFIRFRKSLMLLLTSVPLSSRPSAVHE